MNTPISSLEKHAAALGLTQEDAVPVERVKPPAASTDKVLLGLGCCALAAGSAAISVWMVVPTLILTGAASALLVRHLNAANAASHHLMMGAEFQLDGEAVKRMMDEDQERFDSWNRDIIFNPAFRSSPSNIYHDDHHRR